MARSLLSRRVGRPFAIGPTVWMTCLEGKLNAGVTFACPVGSSCPCLRMISAHASRNCTPANVWMALSMQWCPGTQHPSICELAAFTMASARMVVMSPRQSERRESSGTCGSPSASVAPASSIILCSTRSCTSKNSSLAGIGSRVFTNARNCAKSAPSPLFSICSRDTPSAPYRSVSSETTSSFKSSIRDMA